MNSEIYNEIRDALKIQVGSNEKVKDPVPVIEVNPRLVKCAQIVRRQGIVNQTSGTIYTTPTNQDFYLTAVQMSLLKDATATSLFSYVQVVIGGANQRILEIEGLTLTAQSETASISLTHPVKIDRGSNISLINNTNVANVTSSACIVGFIDEASNA